MLNERQEKRFCELRRAAIAADYSYLNNMQQAGVLTTEGPLLILAGAGSGKTTVLINRISNILKYGSGSDSNDVPAYITEDDLHFLEQYVNNPCDDDKERAERICKLHPVAPWNIIAITFTNKAANELKARLEKMLGPEANDIWAATFHSACVRILRRDIDRLGFSKSFTIYDTDDSLRVIKDIIKTNGMDEKTFQPRAVLSQISKAKDRMMMSADYEAEADHNGEYLQKRYAKIYREYERRLAASDALDFDDIILHTVHILEEFDDVRSYWQNKFRYVLVDEYQDTNFLQYKLTSILAGRWENICVVGDDDQSIYRFRGATIKNILSFEEKYKGARVIRLEQNYRSTEPILNAANAVIANNVGRKGKRLWTEKKGGELITLYTASDENDEARFVASKILEGVAKDQPLSNYAILYRLNAQSNQLEYALSRNGITYKVFGGMKFFDRAEIKDMLAYLCVVYNPADDLRLKRIINTPTRGIGAKTIESAEIIAQQNGVSIFEVISNAGRYPELAKAVGKLNTFVDIIENLRESISVMPLPEWYDDVIARSGYLAALNKKRDENESRIENVLELKSSIQQYVDNSENPELAGFLSEVALYSDLDDDKDNGEYVTLMTVHSAKGLEFPTVFMVGMEESIFPNQRAIGESEEMEEERRLCYVAITRAKTRLYISCANQRMLFGRTSANRVSRFMKEIPDDLLEKIGKKAVDRETEYAKYWGSDFPNYSNGYSMGSGFGSRGYSRRDNPYSDRSTIGQKTKRTSSGAGSSSINISKGDTIRHDAFGQGLVIAVTPMGGDALLEIAFDRVGTKRLMYKSASAHIHKIQL